MGDDDFVINERVRLAMEVLASMDAPPSVKAALNRDRDTAGQMILKLLCRGPKLPKETVTWNGDDMRTTFAVLLEADKLLDPKVWSAKHIEAHPAVEADAHLLARNRWKVEGQNSIFVHDGCGASLARECVSTRIMRYIAAFRYSVAQIHAAS